MSKKQESAKRVNRKLAQAIIDQSGFEGIDGEIIGTAAELFGDLLTQNWTQITAIRKRSEKSDVSVSFTFDVDASGKTPLVRARLGYSEKFKDEAEAYVDDPEQVKMNLMN